MKKFIYFLLVAIFATSMLFLGIGCKEEAVPAEEAAEEVVEEEAAPSEWGNIDWKQFAGTEISAIMLDMPISLVYKPYVAEFEELTGIKVNWEELNETDRKKKVLVDFASGTAEYDVVSIGIADREEFAVPGYIEPLEKFLNDPKLTDAEWFNIEDYLPDVLAGGYSKAGDLVFIPYTAEYYLVWYLKDVFDQLGLKAPKTWDEYEQTVKALDDARQAGEITAYAHFDRTMPGPGEAGWSMFCSASRQGIDLVDFENKISNINTTKGIGFMDWYTSWALTYGPEGSLNWGWHDLAPAFMQGNIAMTIGGNASFLYIEDPAESKIAGHIGYTPPLLKDGGKDPLWEWGWGLNAASKNKEAAWLFVEWLTSPTLISTIAPQFGCPARLSSYSDPAYVEGMPSQEFIDAQTWMMENGIDPTPQITHPNYAEASDIISKEMSNVLAGIKSAEQACADADAALVDIGYTSASE